jgi:hypothetical protein
LEAFQVAPKPDMCFRWVFFAVVRCDMFCILNWCLFQTCETSETCKYWWWW